MPGSSSPTRDRRISRSARKGRRSERRWRSSPRTISSAATAAMAQYDRLWPSPFEGGLPVLFFFLNNFHAMGGQTIGETTGWDRLARIGVAMSPSNLHAETVDGANPLAVADAVERQRALLENGRGPALLDVETY